MAFANAIYVGSFLSTMFPLIVLLWATISKPFASYTFWRSFTVLVGIVIVLRYVFRFKFWGSFNAPPPAGDPCEHAYLRDGCLTFARFMGLYRLSDGPGYMWDMVPDILLLVALTVHCSAMKVLGTACVRASSLRLSKEDYMILEAEGCGDIADEVMAEIDTTHGAEPRRLDSTSSESSSDSNQPPPKRTALVKLMHFYDHILNPATSLPEDYYIASFLLEFASFLVIVFGWDGFRREDEYSTSKGLQADHIPGTLLMFLLLQFLMILVDRALYITRSLKLKLIYHYVSVILIHFLFFYTVPSTTGRSFISNGVLIALYLLKVSYFLVSSYQIRASYPNSVQRNALTKHATFVGWLIFIIYKAIPFMLELRMLLDWSCIPTTLMLQHWHKMEDINGQLFLNRYQIRVREKQNRGLGQAQPRHKKILSGGLLFVLLIFVLWFPLLLMSLVNSNAVPNVPATVDLKLQFNAYEPVFVMDALASTPSIDGADYNQLVRKDDSGFVRSFGADDTQRMLFSPQSKSVWTVSPSSRERLMDVLSDENISVTATLMWSIQRPVKEGVASTITGSNAIDIPYKQQLRLRDILNGSRAAMRLNQLIPSAMHLDKTDRATIGTSLPESLQSYANCTLSRQYAQGREWFTLKQVSKHLATQTDDQPTPTGVEIPLGEWPELITFNDRVIPDTFSFVSSYGVVGLYVSVVLVIGKFLRLTVDQVSHRIIFEDMPQVVTLENLCKAIYIAREHGDLHTEEELFDLLLQLYRSPEALRLWTEPSLLQESDRDE
eukprot:TRINITY_DN9110_c0_g1_i1.p1 TRINITY_DN9110_c0_g1~~TRINITY_DN9110_c0_g1_i1.p1  ORF type:complete len:901 (+),score=178.58 TRINITY_DN9110_c0_g1_i1:368-2704(+)